MNDRFDESPAASNPAMAAAQASELLDRRRFAQARALLADALRDEPQHLDLLFELARADVLEDRNDAARDTLSQMLQLAPSHIGARLLMFVVEMETGRLPEAEMLILGLLREAPQQGELYAHYARLMLRGLNFDKASRLADEGLRFAPNLDICLRARALCDLVVQGQNIDSTALGRLVAGDPHDLHTLRLVVIALLQAGRAREAHQLAQTLLRADPTDASLLQMVQALRTTTHWSMLPLWPLQRWGWAGSIGLWLLMLVGLRVLDRMAPAWSGPATLLLLAYVIYSWVWPPLFRRWVQRD
ncbi:tetratricopeptide repeat protein [Aquabacterium sp.]|uniref:tetratricopeptide repeat protein n=1 Tax=Aquabacterium sp. TaxID=1872578 RepID=UPI002B999BF0|nr:tetratricopeptide repeat protein [Aquabacterium sp.]HSW04988.1 tetratricopeptide repeat protein [Aquabacterium sp.]